MAKRFFEIELRAEGVQSDGQRPTLSGYAAVFDQLSVAMQWGGTTFREKIARGAFASSLGDDIRALWNHDTNLPLGRTKAGTLRLAEDAHGLRVEIDPPDTQAGRDAVESIKRGDVNQMSFAFDVIDEDVDRDEANQIIRTLKKLKLYEVSPVTFPAYPQTSVSARSSDEDVFGDMTNFSERVRELESRDDAERAQARLAVRRRRLVFLA